MDEVLLKFIKFCAVGGSGLIIDFGLTYMCKEKIRINRYLANTIGFITAATSNYILNRIWTFESLNRNIVNEYISFIIVSIIGLLINTGTLWILHGKMKYNFYLSKIGAVGVAIFWNFFANYQYTFSNTLNF
jgi:putative flippase GtrA